MFLFLILGLIMLELLKTVFHSDLGSEFNNWVFFGFRVLLFVELIRVHGLKKIDSKHDTPNPLGLPQKLNNFISILAMLYLPVLGIIGLGTRLVLIPALMVTSIGYFVIHKNDTITIRDIPYMYSLNLLLLIFVGPGSISVDQLIWSSYLQ